ncbi:hypothetical protein Aple_099990 [Acrocarpospora pleiomorpha]|uniref:Uncharacterized protein n=1 Tax=Acrocarpospora pleiomorpha TaxID=90975 RepID=A0A5M3Y1H1_9ACTN|nr:hypothetical protein Aple_099990 [Acrocarpospora pleiomorpha]
MRKCADASDGRDRARTGQHLRCPPESARLHQLSRVRRFFRRQVWVLVLPFAPALTRSRREQTTLPNLKAASPTSRGGLAVQTPVSPHTVPTGGGQKGPHGPTWH